MLILNIKKMACVHMCMCRSQRRMAVSYSVTLCLVHVRQALALNLKERG